MKFRCLRHPIAALSEEVEQYFETPNQALISRPWTSSKKSSIILDKNNQLDKN